MPRRYPRFRKYVVLTKLLERGSQTRALERTVLALYYFEELTLCEISKIIGLHFSRIAQLRVQAVLRLRNHLQRVWFDSPKRNDDTLRRQ